MEPVVGTRHLGFRKRFAIALCVAASFLASAQVARALDGVPSGVPLVLFAHTMDDGESVSQFLYGLGVGRRGSPYLLYSSKSWINVLGALNPGLDLWNTVPPGTIIKVALPLSLVPRVALIAARDEGSALHGVVVRGGKNERWKLVAVEVVTKKGDNLSALVKRAGGADALTGFQVKGREGLAALNARANPGMKSWKGMASGKKIVVVFPRVTGSVDSKALLAEMQAPLPVVWAAKGVADGKKGKAKAESKSVAALPPQPPPPPSPPPPSEPPMAPVAPEIPQLPAVESTGEAVVPEGEAAPDAAAESKPKGFWQWLFGGTSDEDEEEAPVADEPVTPEEPAEVAPVAPPPPPPPPAQKKRGLDIAPVAPVFSEDLALVDDAVIEKTSRRKRKVSPEIEQKAWDVSVFDAMKPGMEGVFQGISTSTASGYLGLRYGLPLVKGDALLEKSRFFGLLAELRGGALGGLRLYWEKAPKVEATVDGDDRSFAWQRLLLGWAFQIESPWLVDNFHITPKIGRYTVSASLPDSAGGGASQDFDVPGALGFGLEVDAELARFWYIARGWAAQDFSIGKSDRDGVTSRRLGLDLFLKGSGFSLGSTRLSMSYLAFVMNESITLTGHDDAGTFELGLQTAYAGLGASLSW